MEISMELFKIAIFVVIVFICTFTIIDRICKCFEQCAMSKAYGKYIGKQNAYCFEKELANE